LYCVCDHAIGNTIGIRKDVTRTGRAATVDGLTVSQAR
jgi:hypothetical protein